MRMGGGKEMAVQTHLTILARLSASPSSAVCLPAVLRLAHGGHQGGKPEGGWFTTTRFPAAWPCVLLLHVLFHHKAPSPTLSSPLSLQAGMLERSKLLAAEWAGLSDEAKLPFADQAKVLVEFGRV